MTPTSLHRAVRRLVRKQRSSSHPHERRGEERVEFVQPVRVRTEDQREFTLLTRDLSPTGVRLIGTRRLLGQKVRVLVPVPGGDELYEFVVRVLWTCPVGEDLVENGGAFLSVSEH
jgi:predicted RNA-binding protein with PUA domain